MPEGSNGLAAVLGACAVLGLAISTKLRRNLRTRVPREDPEFSISALRAPGESRLQLDIRHRAEQGITLSDLRLLAPRGIDLRSAPSRGLPYRLPPARAGEEVMARLDFRADVAVDQLRGGTVLVSFAWMDSPARPIEMPIRIRVSDNRFR